MISDPDIFRAAKLLIDQHGEGADLCANWRGKELLLRGHFEASTPWRQIFKAIEKLQSGRREGEAIN